MIEVLSSLDSRLLPPLAARLLFWQGYGAQQRGDQARADTFWRRLLRISPGGYYAWRAQLRLQDAVASAPAAAMPPPQAGKPRSWPGSPWAAAIGSSMSSGGWA